VADSTDGQQAGPDMQTGFKEYYNNDLMMTADRITREYEQCYAAGTELIIAIDDTGLGGGVSDKLKRDGIPHFAVNFSQKPKGLVPGKEVANARAEMYYLLSKELRDGKILLLHHPRFQQELSSIRLAVSKANGSYKMEDKDLTKKRLGRSPDFADATALARYALQLHKYAKREKFMP
jgi:hypothetical protein